MKVLVIGGTLFIGRALVTELVKAGHEVTVLHRRAQHDLGAVSRKQIGNLMADRNDPAQIREALAGQRFEVVFDNVYDWERGTTAAQVEATGKELGEVRAQAAAAQEALEAEKRARLSDIAGAQAKLAAAEGAFAQCSPQASPATKASALGAHSVGRVCAWRHRAHWLRHLVRPVSAGMPQTQSRT